VLSVSEHREILDFDLCHCMANSIRGSCPSVTDMLRLISYLGREREVGRISQAQAEELKQLLVALYVECRLQPGVERLQRRVDRKARDLDACLEELATG
jgi:hypothetical protein